MSKIIEKLEIVFFRNYAPYNEIYKKLCSIYFKDAINILHLGAGEDSLGMHRIKEAKFNFISLDIDGKGLIKNGNRHKILGDANILPFKNDIFDLIIADSFFEHIKDPQSVLSECARVSKKRSSLIFTTPNRFSYISLFNLYAPGIIKTLAIKMRGVDITYFPAYYKFNTEKAIKLFSKRAGYEINALHGYIGPPAYCNFSLVLWLLFVVWHKIIENIKNTTEKLSIVFLGILRNVKA